MRKLIAFLFWIPRYVGRGIAKVHQDYVNVLKSDPGIGFILMILLTALLFFISLLTTIVIGGSESPFLGVVVAVSLTVLPLEYFYVQIQKLYQIFNKERQATFNSLK